MPSRGLRVNVGATPGMPLPNGILGPAVTIIDVDGHELNGVDWQPLSCCDAHCWDDNCPPGQSPGQSPGQPPTGNPKLFCRPGWQSAPPVTVYSGVECSTVGFTYAEATVQARTALTLGQQRAVEQFVWTHILTDKATDRTPATGPVGFPQAIGLLEGWLATNYGGLGTLHIPAAGGPLMCSNNLMRHEGQRLRSCSAGHGVIIGAGYQVNTGPGGTPAPDGTVWLAASGPVTVRRELVEVVPGTEQESIRIQTNDRMVLAERTFVVQVSCTVEMVLASLGCCC